MNNGLIIMTALLPTVGHKNLIEFGRQFLSARGGHLTVLISSRSFEPIYGTFRKQWLEDELYREIRSGAVSIVLSEIDDAPQNPEDHPDFWNWWKNTIISETGISDFEYLFASEPYGIPLAEVLGAKYIPYDQERVITNVSSTAARTDLRLYWDQILEGPRIVLERMFGRFCLFGQESVGKTTFAKHLARRDGYGFQPEWARPYLETVGPELTKERMYEIFSGQWAQSNSTMGDHPITIMDTDLMSTIGYMRLKGWEFPVEWIEDVVDTKATHYFVLPDDIPFEEDQLRYGGKVRETDTQYWIDLLEEFDCEYTIVPKGSYLTKLQFMSHKIHKIHSELVKPLSDFIRT